MYADRTPLEIWCRSVNPMSGSMSQVNLLIKTVLKTSPVQISGPPIYHSILLRGVWDEKKDAITSAHCCRWKVKARPTRAYEGPTYVHDVTYAMGPIPGQDHLLALIFSTVSND
jgi:hypothetical protein